MSNLYGPGSGGERNPQLSQPEAVTKHAHAPQDVRRAAMLADAKAQRVQVHLADLVAEVERRVVRPQGSARLIVGTYKHRNRVLW